MQVARLARAQAEARRQVEGEALGRGVYQVMAMLSPFLVGDARLLEAIEIPDPNPALVGKTIENQINLRQGPDSAW